MTIQERVEAGAAWLDVNRPGWVDRINLETLELSDTCHCVLGQEYGHYWENVNEGAVAGVGDSGNAVDLGFAASFAEDGEFAYERLTDTWRDLIVERRAAVLPHGAPHCSCVIPCETCGADTVSGYLAGCEECSERRQCGYDRAEFGDVPAIIPGGVA